MRRSARLALALSLLVLGCAELRQWPTNPASDLKRAERLFETARYSEAAEIYRTVLKNAPHDAEAVEAQYRLAFLLSFYQNPDRDYAASLREYQKLLSEYPDSPYIQTAENSASLLSFLASQKETLAAERAEVKRLKENLRQLQELEIQAEQKRTEVPLGPRPSEPGH